VSIPASLGGIIVIIVRKGKKKIGGRGSVVRGQGEKRRAYGEWLEASSIVLIHFFFYI
jgi:hypothetical protein